MSDDNRLQVSLLLEFYGSLLSERQRQIVDLAVNDDLSLGEIAEITGITRQGVRDAMIKAEGELFSYEEKLGMYHAYLDRQQEGDKLSALIELHISDSLVKREALELISSICS